MISARVQESMVTDIQCDFDSNEMAEFIGCLCKELTPGGWASKDQKLKEFFLEDLVDCLNVAFEEDNVGKYWELDTAVREHFTSAYMKMHTK